MKKYLKDVVNVCPKCKKGSAFQKKNSRISICMSCGKEVSNTARDKQLKKNINTANAHIVKDFEKEIKKIFK